MFAFKLVTRTLERRFVNNPVGLFETSLELRTEQSCAAESVFLGTEFVLSCLVLFLILVLCCNTLLILLAEVVNI